MCGLILPGCPGPCEHGHVLPVPHAALFAATTCHVRTKRTMTDERENFSDDTLRGDCPFPQPTNQAKETTCKLAKGFQERKAKE